MCTCIGLVVPLGRMLCLITYYLLLQVVVEKHCLDLLLITHNDILKKKDAHVQVKLTSFSFLEKHRKVVRKYGPLPSLPTLIHQCPSKKT